MSRSRGEPLVVTAHDAERLMARVITTATCAVLDGTVGSDGYGRIAFVRPDGRQRTVTPQHVAAVLAGGNLPAGVTLLHECDVRLCVRFAPGHVQIGTQAENMRHAVRRGRARGRRPGMVDLRGEVAASRALRAALRRNAGASPEQLADIITEVVWAGHPMRDHGALFEL